MSVFIKWQYIVIDDDEINNLTLNLRNNNDLDISKKFQTKYPDLYKVLFKQIDKYTVELLFPKSYYLSDSSSTEKDLILARFINDCSNNGPHDIKPINLSIYTYPIEVYEWFSYLIEKKQVKPAINYKYSSLTLGFNDTMGYVCSNGNEAHEISITISRYGVKWEWWPNK